MAALAEFRSSVDFGVAGDLYFVEENSNNGQAFANIFVESAGKNSRLWVDIGAGGLIAEAGHTYIKAPEVYFQWGRKSFASLYLGRWRNQWSIADSHWNLGFTQPVFAFDASRPEIQGLSGVFIDLPKMGKFRMTLFGSQLFLPSQGASYELADGRLTSSNPWFVAPVEAVGFSGEEFILNYEIDTPDITKIVSQSSGGLGLKYNERDNGVFSGLFYLYKPKNDLLLPFEGNLNLSTFRGDVVVQPIVAQHHTAGIDMGWRNDFVEVVASTIYEGGVELNGPANTTYPEIPDQNLYSGLAKLNHRGNHQLWLSYMKIEREETEVLGVFAGNDITVFSARNRFDHAIRLELRDGFLTKNGVQTLKTRAAYTYDPEDEASWISASASWRALASLEIFSQCDFFGSTRKVSDGNDIIDKFQNNDRCLLGGSYAF